MAAERLITLSKGGTDEKIVNVTSITVPDLWPIIDDELGYDTPNGQKVCKCWHLCHDLLNYILELEGRAEHE